MAKQVAEALEGGSQNDGGSRSSRHLRRRGWAVLAAFAVTGALLGASSPALADGSPPPGYYGQPPQGVPYYAPTGGYVTSGSYGMQPIGPKYLDWDDGDPIPPGYHPTTRIRRGLVIGGAVTFGSMYLLTAFSAAILVESHVDSSAYSPLFAPAIGPFITIGTSHSSGVGTFVLVLDGLAQTGGIAMFIAGLAAPRSALARNDVAKTKITPLPMTFGRSSAGVGLVGTF